MAAAAPAADVIKAVQGYINKILKPRDPSKAISGMKCLLLDRETVSMHFQMLDPFLKDH